MPKKMKKYEEDIYELKKGIRGHIHCPRCKRVMSLLREETHLVGCMEYNIYICAWCRVLFIQYPHESSGTENKVIEI